jgi:hypothetical protein
MAGGARERSVGVAEERPMLRQVVARAMVAGLALGAGGCSTAGGPLDTTAPGWEQHFTLTWETVERHGRLVLRGEVLNRYVLTAERVRLLVEGLDSAGQVVSQQVIWLGRPVAPSGRSYFETAVPGGAASYRVRMYAFIWADDNIQ